MPRSRDPTLQFSSLLSENAIRHLSITHCEAYQMARFERLPIHGGWYAQSSCKPWSPQCYLDQTLLLERSNHAVEDVHVNMYMVL